MYLHATKLNVNFSRAVRTVWSPVRNFSRAVRTVWLSVRNFSRAVRTVWLSVRNFSRAVRTVWLPVRNTQLPVRTFSGTRFKRLGDPFVTRSVAVRFARLTESR